MSNRVGARGDRGPKDRPWAARKRLGNPPLKIAAPSSGAALSMPATTFALADSMRRLGTESAFVVLARARQLEAQGRNIIHLEIGEPDFDTPEHVKQAGIDSIRRNRTHYTPASGIAELRDAIAAHVSRTRGVPVTSDRVVVSPGA